MSAGLGLKVLAGALELGLNYLVVSPKTRIPKTAQGRYREVVPDSPRPRQVAILKTFSLLVCAVLTARGATTFAAFTTTNAAASFSTNVNGTWNVYGNGTLNETITGTAALTFPSTVTAGAPNHPSITSGTDAVTHAVPGFPTSNFSNAGLLAFGSINTFQSTMYWGSIPGNSTGSGDQALWTITYNFSAPVPAGVRIVLFDIGVGPNPPINTFTIKPTLSAANVNTAGWTSQAYAPAQASGNTETATFVPGTIQASFNSIGTPTGNYIFVTANTFFDKLVFTGQSSRYNAFSIGFESDLVTPEPGTFGLAGGGILALILFSRRAKAQAAVRSSTSAC